jgi:hypothetical protein
LVLLALRFIVIANVATCIDIFNTRILSLFTGFAIIVIAIDIIIPIVTTIFTISTISVTIFYYYGKNYYW